MKSEIIPLKAYGTPKYPTIAEIGRADLSRVPARWQGLHAVAATLGAAAMTLKAIALDAESAKPVADAPVVAVPDAAKDGAKPFAAVAKTPVTDVCPLLPTAIAGEGRGGFGCVAMNPPVILSEGEALEIIEREFKRHGIELVDAPILEGAMVPARGREAEKLMWRGNELDELIERKKKAGASEEELKSLKWVGYFSKTTNAELQMPLVKREWRMDFGSSDGRVMVEYISANDEDLWLKSRVPNTGWSTGSYCDVRDAAERAVKGFSARTEGRPMTIGVFYDPLASAQDDDSDEMGERLSWEERKKRGKERAEAKLKAQIEAFFEHLSKTKANAPDAIIDACEHERFLIPFDCLRYE